VKRLVQQGFSLLEIMIALLVISVGALGLTKAQIDALQGAYDAGLRTTASILVQDMAARIQANAGEALKGNQGGYMVGTPVACTLPTGSGQICTGNRMALHDRYDWKQLIESSFPGNSSPSGTITMNPSGGSVNYTITIAWQSWQSRASDGPVDQRVATTIVPPLIRGALVTGGGMMPSLNP
jgi:type IV pilus assembly protein PilV